MVIYLGSKSLYYSVKSRIHSSRFYIASLTPLKQWQINDPTLQLIGFTNSIMSP